MASLDVTGEIERVRTLYDDAAARKLWRARRLKAELDALEAQLPPPPAPAPRLSAIPFYEYDVSPGARRPDPVVNAPINAPHPGRSPVPPPLPDPGPPTYDVRPGPRMRDPQ